MHELLLALGTELFAVSVACLVVFAVLPKRIKANPQPILSAIITAVTLVVVLAFL